VPRIAEIWIYPVKGLRGRRLETAAVEPWGLEGDRRWMVVDRDGRFVSQREAPDMARVEVEPRPGGLRLSMGGRGSVEVATPDASAPRIATTVWRADVQAALADAAAGDWLAQAIGVDGARLVHMADPAHARPVKPEHGKPGDRVTFADEAPMLLTTRASLDDLNRRLERPVPMDRFRPNLVLDDCEAWAEDGWSRLRAGEVELSVGWPCSRCVVTTTDQASGARAEDGEPLRTLASFRPARGGPRFGWNLIPRRLGRIAVGDPVEAA
jgi:uncharacterized protein YcbX